MVKAGLVGLLAFAVLSFGSSDMLAAQKTKKPAKAAPAKETPYQYCKRMIAKDIGSVARVHHVVVSPSGKITCWYYG